MCVSEGDGRHEHECHARCIGLCELSNVKMVRELHATRKFSIPWARSCPSHFRACPEPGCWLPAWMGLYLVSGRERILGPKSLPRDNSCTFFFPRVATQRSQRTIYLQQEGL